MSDSGRRLGDCRHARAREWCPDCLRARVAELETLLRPLAGLAEVFGPNVPDGTRLGVAREFPADITTMPTLGDARRAKRYLED